MIHTMCKGKHLQASCLNLKKPIRFTSITRRKHDSKAQTQSLETDQNTERHKKHASITTSMNWESRTDLIDATWPTVKSSSRSVPILDIIKLAGQHQICTHHVRGTAAARPHQPTLRHRRNYQCPHKIEMHLAIHALRPVEREPQQAALTFLGRRQPSRNRPPPEADDYT